MKKLLVILLSLMMLFGIFAATASAAGISFTDVKPSDWFYDDVKNAVNMGLVNGKSATIYAPDDNLTYAEAVKLAACMHERYTTGSVTQTNSPTGNWYDSCVNYAKSNGIVSSNFNWDATATRAGYMSIFAHALPDSALQAINNVPDDSIPDVKYNGYYYGPDIYKLYRAGVVQGVDAQFNCNPRVLKGKLGFLERLEAGGDGTGRKLIWIAGCIGLGTAFHSCLSDVCNRRRDTASWKKPGALNLTISLYNDLRFCLDGNADPKTRVQAACSL